jgi:hypothetical protein
MKNQGSVVKFLEQVTTEKLIDIQVL